MEVYPYVSCFLLLIGKKIKESRNMCLYHVLAFITSSFFMHIRIKYALSVYFPFSLCLCFPAHLGRHSCSVSTDLNVSAWLASVVHAYFLIVDVTYSATIPAWLACVGNPACFFTDTKKRYCISHTVFM